MAVDITPSVPSGRQIIEAYGGGRFRIAGISHLGSVLVLPGRSIAWPVTEVSQVTLEGLSPLWDERPPVELLLLGCGQRLLPVPGEFRAALRGRGVALELMDTGAACRGFNFLLAEERRVAAALIAVP